MVAVAERRMPTKGRGGRPKKDEGEKGTRHVRVFADLADMLGDIIDVEGGSVANLIDGWLRVHVVARHASLKKQIDAMRKAREEAQRKQSSE